MQTSGTNKRYMLRASILVLLIGIAFVMQRPDPISAETTLTNGYFVAVGDGQRFDVHFDESGDLSVRAPFGDFEGRWEVVGESLCLQFQDEPRAGRNCELISREGPMSLRLGDRLFLAKLANALSLS